MSLATSTKAGYVTMAICRVGSCCVHCWTDGWRRIRVHRQGRTWTRTRRKRCTPPGAAAAAAPHAVPDAGRGPATGGIEVAVASQEGGIVGIGADVGADAGAVPDAADGNRCIPAVPVLGSDDDSGAAAVGVVGGYCGGGCHYQPWRDGGNWAAHVGY